MKRYISLLMIGLLSFTMTASVSCDRTETPVAPASQEPTETELEAQLAEMERYNAQFFGLVDRVEPYVTTNKDQTWSVDWEGFTAANPNLTAEEAEILVSLKEGLPLANAAVSEALKAPADVQAYWTNYYWWGKRECYTGSSADWAIYLLRIGSYTMVLWSRILGFTTSSMVAFLSYLKSQCGGFCLYTTWWGAAWVTCP